MHEASKALQRNFSRVSVQSLSPSPALPPSTQGENETCHGGLEKRELRSEAGSWRIQENFMCLHHLIQVLKEGNDFNKWTGRGHFRWRETQQGIGLGRHRVHWGRHTVGGLESQVGDTERG